MSSRRMDELAIVRQGIGKTQKRKRFAGLDEHVLTWRAQRNAVFCGTEATRFCRDNRRWRTPAVKPTLFIECPSAAEYIGAT